MILVGLMDGSYGIVPAKKIDTPLGFKWDNGFTVCFQTEKAARRVKNEAVPGPGLVVEADRPRVEVPDEYKEIVLKHPMYGVAFYIEGGETAPEKPKKKAAEEVKPDDAPAYGEELDTKAAGVWLTHNTNLKLQDVWKVLREYAKGCRQEKRGRTVKVFYPVDLLQKIASTPKYMAAQQDPEPIGD